MPSDLKIGDKINLTALVQEVRASGVVVLSIPASASLIPAVVLTTRELLSGAEPPPPVRTYPPTTSPEPPPSSLAVGTAVHSRKGERGEVVAPVPSVPRVKRLHGRADALMVHWHGRALPTWEAPEDVQAAR